MSAWKDKVNALFDDLTPENRREIERRALALAIPEDDLPARYALGDLLRDIEMLDQALPSV